MHVHITSKNNTNNILHTCVCVRTVYCTHVYSKFMPHAYTRTCSQTPPCKVSRSYYNIVTTLDPHFRQFFAHSACSQHCNGSSAPSLAVCMYVCVCVCMYFFPILPVPSTATVVPRRCWLYVCMSE